MEKKRKLSKNSVRKYSDPIPNDLLIDIFSRVHAKSIARFRCVSKRWRSLLKRSDFTELFLTRSLTCPPRFLFSFEVDKELFFFSSPQEPNLDNVPKAQNSHRFSRKRKKRNLDDFSSVVVATRYSTSFPKYVPTGYQTLPCGLVLLRGYWAGKLRVICNPATGEFINLPKLLKVEPKIERICFGYDPIRKQFKVLCMTSSNTHWVLTLEPRKHLWRRVDSKFCFSSDRRIEDKICINGVMYFGTRLQESIKIVCFDVRSEEFNLINTRKAMFEEGSYIYGPTTFLTYKGKLGIYQRKSRAFLNFDLWVLGDAENQKWSKHRYKFDFSRDFSREMAVYDHPFLRVVGFLRDTDELVFAPYCLLNPFYLIYYNLESNTFKRVIIQGFEEFLECDTFKIVRIPGFKEFKLGKRIRIHTSLDYSENVKLFK